jgi:hypothetical protein
VTFNNQPVEPTGIRIVPDLLPKEEIEVSLPLIDASIVRWPPNTNDVQAEIEIHYGPSANRIDRRFVYVFGCIVTLTPDQTKQPCVVLEWKDEKIAQ